MNDQTDVRSRMAEVRQQQEELVFDSFGIQDGIALGLRMLEIATERSLPVMISVTHGAHPVFRVGLPGSVPDDQHWLTRKSGAVLRFGVPSYLVQLQHEARGERFEHPRPAPAIVPVPVECTRSAGCTRPERELSRSGHA